MYILWKIYAGLCTIGEMRATWWVGEDNKGRLQFGQDVQSQMDVAE